MKKKLLALMLGMSMAAGLLAGCGSSTASTAAPASTEKADEEDGKDTVDEPVEEITETLAEKAIRERKESGVLPTVTMAFPSFVGEPAGLDRVERAISTYTEATLGLKVDLLVTDFGSYVSTVKDLLENGGKIDLFSTIGVGYLPSMKAGYLKNLEEDNLYAEYGADIPSAIDEVYLAACREADGLYTITTNRDIATGLGGVAVDKECLDLAGVDYQSMYTNPDVDIIFLTGDELTEILKKVQKACPDRCVMGNTRSLESDTRTSLGGDICGVLAEDGSLTVVNPLDTEGVVSFAKRMREWEKLGFFGEMNESTDMERVKRGDLAAYQLQVIGTSKDTATKQCGKEMIIFQCGNTVVQTSAITNAGWSMNRNSENPVAAMQLLNACYTDPVLADLLCWGEEGVDYQLTEDGHAAFQEGVDMANSEYYMNVNWLLPNQFNARVWEGNSLNMWEKLRAYELTAEENPALGFWFDSSTVGDAADKIYMMNGFVQWLQNSYSSFEEVMDEAKKMVEEYGLDQYIEAKQAALDEWAAARGLK